MSGFKGQFKAGSPLIQAKGRSWAVPPQGTLSGRAKLLSESSASALRFDGKKLSQFRTEVHGYHKAEASRKISQRRSARATSTTVRNSAGVAKDNSAIRQIKGTWLRGSEGNAGLFPKQVAEKMSGKEFRNFSHFRKEFWKTVEQTPDLARQFQERDLRNMRSGKAPVVNASQNIGTQAGYVLHHSTPIHRGGGVYDMNNIVIVTPRYHKEILSKDYHYGREKKNNS
jgi:hypothetical protein